MNRNSIIEAIKQLEKDRHDIMESYFYMTQVGFSEHSEFMATQVEKIDEALVALSEIVGYDYRVEINVVEVE